MQHLVYADGSRRPVYNDGFVELFDGLEVQIPEGALPGDSWEILVRPFVLENKAGSATLGDSVFISNEQLLLSEVKGNLVQTHRDTQETEGWVDLTPKATYNIRTPRLVVHYNHIFTAEGRTLRWTDLDNVWNWYPRPTNEADFRTIEWENEDISAIAVVNDILFIHFPTAVYTCEYVGKPSIVRISQRNEGHGAVAQNALVVHKNSQFFMGVDNFYQWSPIEGILPIGEDIWRRILSPDINAIHTYVDRIHKEIHWVIGEFIWAFNYVERSWARYSSNDILDHTTVTAMSSVSFADMIEESGSVFEPDRPEGLYNLVCREDGLYREWEAGDNLTSMVVRDKAFLVSDEQTYGDIHHEKDTDTVVVDGSYGVGLDGFEVSVSAKRYVSDVDEFKSLGFWKHSRQFKQADGGKRSGRSLKFKFEVQDQVARWDGEWQTEGHLFVEGLRLFTWDGRYKMDDKVKMTEMHRGLWDGGTNYLNGQQRLDIDQFNLYAWGEKVMIPEPPSGEDK